MQSNPVHRAKRDRAGSWCNGEGYWFKRNQKKRERAAGKRTAKEQQA